VDVVQLREKEMEAAPLLAYCEVVRRHTRDFDALFIVNDRVDVALAAAADGVHLGQDDLPVADARRQLGRGLLIGMSTHSESEIEAAGEVGADYLGVGPVHATPTKPGRPAVGYELVEYAAEKALIPFFAIGGIGLGNVAQVVAAGAPGISVARAITEAAAPVAVVRRLKAALLSAKPHTL
jgi:thiamine-phosphate pyrophosphorylase